MEIMACAVMGSSLLRSRLIATLVAPVSSCCMPTDSIEHVEPLIGIIAQSLSVSTSFETVPERDLTTRTLSLLLNATHNCYVVGRACGAQVLQHMAAMLLAALADVDASMELQTKGQEPTADAFTLALGILCFLVNVVEQCPDSALILANMELSTLMRASTDDPDRRGSQQPVERKESLNASQQGQKFPVHQHCMAQTDVPAFVNPQLTFMSSKGMSNSPKRSPAKRRHVSCSKRAPSGCLPRGRRVGVPAHPGSSALAGTCTIYQPRTTVPTVCTCAFVHVLWPLTISQSACRVKQILSSVSALTRNPCFISPGFSV